MNVLCTPPAFILSQDQTLDNLFILRLSAVDTFYRALFRSLTLLSSLRSLRSNLFLRISGSHKFFRRTASRQRVVFPFCFCCSFFNVPVRRPRSPADSLNILPHAPYFVNNKFNRILTKKQELFRQDQCAVCYNAELRKRFYASFRPLDIGK